MNTPLTKTMKFGDAEMTFETGRMAGQANGSIYATWGETALLVTVTMANPREGIDFFPLTVEYVEKMYAGGLISSSRFVKRERHPSSDAILKARVIDRSIRPLFPEGFSNDVQVIVTVLSYDNEHDPAMLAVNATSAALMISDIPFEGPVSGIRVSISGDDFVINPVEETYETADLDLIISASKDSIVMIESGANEVGEDKMIEALNLAKETSVSLIEFQEDIAREWGKEKIQEYYSTSVESQDYEEVFSKFGETIKEAVYTSDRKIREEMMKEVSATMYTEYEGEFSKSYIDRISHEITKNLVVEGVVKDGKRPDGRGFDEIRPLSASVGILPRTHGSGLFQRGLTQALTVATLASGKMELLVEDIGGETTKRYMHHYNFKPFCTGETGRYSYYPGRRELGHGALGERALLPVIPSKEVFPYTIRLVSEILSANGSTSMAATCGSTLALMDAGVPIKAPVAGIAMGLMKAVDSDEMVILTDIQGFEDHFGDMDFKVTGTRQGITALQMDNKLKGIPMDIISSALEKAKTARYKILDLIEEVIPEPRKVLSKYAPKISQLKIDTDKIGDLIGPGGKVIRGISEETGVEIEVEEDGTVNIAGHSAESIEKAKQMVNEVVFEPEVGQIYEGIVVRVENYGAFVELSSSVSGLVHVSELKDGFVKDANEEVKVGQKVKVKVTEVDEKGRINLSIKKAV